MHRDAIGEGAIGEREIVDTVGVGFGPANIALAVAHAECSSPRSLTFVEANDGPAWQAGMIIDGSDIQHNPLRDFITPKNPCSPYGFLSYLKSEDRLFHFLNLDAPYPPRSDFARYVNWVADQFKEQTHYSEAVTAISLCDDPASASGRRLVRVDTGSRSLWGRSLSFAPGRSKNIPEIFQPLLGDNVFHFTEYTGRRDLWKAGNAPKSVAVIGSSQSSVEIILDLRGSLPGTKTHSVFRKFSYVLKDTSPFTEDLLFPKFTDYFYNSSPESKKQLNEQVLRSNYGSVDEDVLKELYFVLYENKVRGDSSILVHNNREVVAATHRGAGVELVLRDQHTGQVETILVDAVILATGFRNFGTAENEELCHPLLRDIADSYEKNEDGTLRVTRSYQAVPRDEDKAPPLVLNGLCESSHGLGDAGSFSLLSYRAFDIERALAEALDPLMSSGGRPPDPRNSGVSCT